MLPPSLLILDETTLFYHSFASSLSPVKTSAGLVEGWAAEVRKFKPKPFGGIPTAPSTITNRSHNRVTASSTAIVTSETAPALPTSKISDTKGGYVKYGGFVEDFEDDTKERQAALLSPIKGGQRLTSVVRQ